MSSSPKSDGQDTEKKLPARIRGEDNVRMLIESQSKDAQYKSIQPLWDSWKRLSNFSDDVEEFVDSDGKIPQQTYNSCVSFANYLDKLPGMTYSKWAKAMNFLAKKLELALALHNKPNITGLVRGLSQIKHINRKWERQRSAPVREAEGGELVFKDIQAHLESEITQEQMVHAARSLLGRDPNLRMGELYALNTLVDLRSTHMMSGRSEYDREEKLCFNFTRSMPRIGRNGHTATCVLTNGGKTNSSGRLVYSGTVAHANPLLAYCAAKGLLLGYRFGGLVSEEAPDFLNLKDFFLRPSLRSHKDFRKEMGYQAQLRNFNRLYAVIGFSGISSEFGSYQNIIVFTFCYHLIFMLFSLP